MEDNADTKTILAIVEVVFKAVDDALVSAKAELTRKVREQQEEEEDAP